MLKLLLPLAWRWIAERSQEKSTYAGLFVLLAGHLGLYFSPEMKGAIVQALIDISGAVLIAVNSRDAVRRFGVAKVVTLDIPPPAVFQSPPDTTAADLNRAELDRLRRGS